MTIEYRVHMRAEVERIERDDTGAVVARSITDVNEDMRSYTPAFAKSDTVARKWRAESAERARALGTRAVENVLANINQHASVVP